MVTRALWALALMLLASGALGRTLRPRSEIEETGLAPPPDTFFYRHPLDNETDLSAPFFSHGVVVAAAASGDAAAAESKKRVVVEDPVVVPFGRAQDRAPNGSTYRARRFVISNLDYNKANFLLYPYEFSYDADGDPLDNTTVAEKFDDGAFISTLPSSEFPQPHETFFHWVNMSSDIDLSKAKAVYDVNVAVLQVSLTTGDGVEDVTYESDQFCTMFYSYVSGKYSRCFNGLYEYEQFIAQNPTKAQNPFFMFVNPANISAGVLTNAAGENRFGILIIPDIAFTRRSYVASLLNAGRQQIIDFVARGGVLMTSGKAALLLENIGLLTAGTFDSTNTMRSPKTTWAYGNGCDGAGTAPADDSEAEFVRRTLCFTAPTDGNYILTSITSAPLLSGTSTQLTPLAWYDTTLSWAPLKAHNENTGADSDLPLAGTPRSYPSLAYRAHGKGFIVCQMSNPSYNFGSMEWIYNAFFLAGSRPIILSNDVIGGFNRTIPALEQVKLQVELKLTNYFTQDIAGPITVSVWYRNGTAVKFLSGSSCTEVASTTTPPSDLVYRNTRFDCSLSGGLARLSSKQWRFSVYVEDVLVTQAGKDVLLLYPKIDYVDPRANTARTVSYGVTVWTHNSCSEFSFATRRSLLTTEEIAVACELDSDWPSITFTNCSEPCTGATPFQCNTEGTHIQSFSTNVGGFEITESFLNLTALDTILLHSYGVKAPGAWFSSMDSLRTLKMTYWMTGWPSGIARLTRLTSLDISWNFVGDANFGKLENLTSLESLNLWVSRLHSVDGIGRFTALKSLLLGGNDLTSLPEEIGKLSELTELVLTRESAGYGNNQISALPDSICSLSKLTRLAIENNVLTVLPDCTGNLSSLSSVSLDGNFLVCNETNHTSVFFNACDQSKQRSCGQFNTSDNCNAFLVCQWDSVSGICEKRRRPSFSSSSRSTDSKAVVVIEIGGGGGSASEIAAEVAQLLGVDVGQISVIEITPGTFEVTVINEEVAQQLVTFIEKCIEEEASDQ